MNQFDIVFICETHCSRDMKIEIKGYKEYNHPCKLASVKDPRGGVIMYVKNDIEKYITDVNTDFNDNSINQQ